MTNQHSPAPNPLDPRMQVQHDRIEINLADGRTWTLRYGSTRERRKRYSLSDQPRCASPESILANVIDTVGLDCHFVYIDGPRLPLFDHHRQSADPVRAILQGAAWLLLANVLQRHNRPPVLSYSDYNTLLSIHPSYPEPPAAVIPFDAEHACAWIGRREAPGSRTEGAWHGPQRRAGGGAVNLR